MGLGSRSFRALVRRNVICRKRRPLNSLLELVVPIALICVLLAIKLSLEDSSGFTEETVEPTFPADAQTIIPFSFTDYITAIQAERKCYIPAASHSNSNDKDDLAITGIFDEGYNWQVPFVKCDGRACEKDGEDAKTKYCEYNILALTSVDGATQLAQDRVQSFEDFVKERYPQLQDIHYSLLQKFDNETKLEEYVKAREYGKTGFPKVGIAIVFDSKEAHDDDDDDDSHNNNNNNNNNNNKYEYKIRVNSTNFTPDQEEAPLMRTTPPTDKTFNHYEKSDDNSCELEDGTPSLGTLEDSCTGQYMYNGAITMQRLVDDWIIKDSRSSRSEDDDTVGSGSGSSSNNRYVVAESGVRFVSFPTKEYVKNGFYASISGFAPLLITLGLMYPVAAIIRAITIEKEGHQKELMKMMSVTESDIGWSWFISYLVFDMIVVITATACTSSLYSNSSVGLLFFFWLLTIIAAVIIFGMLISSFMTKSTRATMIGLLLFLVGFFLTIAVDFETGPSAIIGWLSLHPLTAFSYGIYEIGRLEDAGVGVTWDTWDSTDSPSGFTFRNSITSLLFDSILWGIVAWYLNRVISSSFSQPLKWYFPFTASYWCPGRVQAPPPQVVDMEGEEESNPLAFLEPVSDALKEQVAEGRCIQIRGLTKKYGETFAVDNLNLTMYSGQVTALLGHNGAGKTTTINMLTGMVGPTTGHAVVAGKDMETQMHQIRQETGICLQHDCLFPYLTVQEHIELFAAIKGIHSKMSREEAEAAIQKSIMDVALVEKSNTLSSNLSGGMKRKLSVAIAFCGDSKTVLLDEPTSGMDPFSRRFTWDVIRQYRQDRCIILTTHFMDEADILGDRIAIMSKGQLRCAGSSLFLKKSYGVGYQLTIEKKTKMKNVKDDTKNTNVPDTVASNESSTGHFGDSGIEDTLNSIVVGAVKEATLLSNVGTEMSFQLPLGSSSKFRLLFNDLDEAVDNGDIVTYGVSITTLDEVFLMVARGDTGEKPSLKSSEFSSRGISAKEMSDHSMRSSIDLESDLFSKHVRALFMKRAMNFKRDKKAWCCSTILPVLFVLLGFIVYKIIPSRDLDPLTLKIKDYNEGSETPVPYNTGNFTCQPGRCLYDHQVNVPETDESYTFCGFVAWDKNAKETCSITEASEIVSNLPAGETVIVQLDDDVDNISKSSYELITSSEEYSASQYGALYFSRDLTSIVAVEDDTNNTYYGETMAKQCKSSIGEFNYTPHNDSQCDYYKGIGYVVSYNFTAVHAALLYQALADEAIANAGRTDKSKISIETTIHPLPITEVEDGWGEADDSFVAWFLIVLSFPFIAGTFGTFVVAERLSKAKHLQNVAGVKHSAYWLSTYLWDIINYQIPLWCTVILMFAFDVDTFITTRSGVLGGVLTLFVLFGPAAAGFTYCVSFAFDSPSMCNLFVIIFNFLVGMAGPYVIIVLLWIGKNPANPKDSLVLAAHVIQWFLRPIPSFCLGNALVNAIYIEVIRQWEYQDVTVWDGPVMRWEILCLGLECVLYIVLAIQIDKWSAHPRAVAMWKTFVKCDWLCRRHFRIEAEQQLLADDDCPQDVDVTAEALRVTSDDAIDDQIILRELTKQYPNGKLAVNNMSFGVPTGECFGLLGTNGAGKTTTMGILTAEFPPTSGDAILSSFSVTREPEKTRRCIGYCPQFDAHFQNMTGREHVELYALIKGIPVEHVQEASDALLNQVGLEDQDKDRLTTGYSGGMKRKLSVACAMIGEPSILFLDEPSTGMDPLARRDLWKVISDMVVGGGGGQGREQKTSVILTTHSMEEAEALCPRIGIMANGRLSCLGSAQHLKSRFGQGYQVELKLRDVKDDDPDFCSVVAKLVLFLQNRRNSTSQEQLLLGGGDEERLQQAASFIRRSMVSSSSSPFAIGGGGRESSSSTRLVSRSPNPNESNSSSTFFKRSSRFFRKSQRQPQEQSGMMEEASGIIVLEDDQGHSQIDIENMFLHLDDAKAAARSLMTALQDDNDDDSLLLLSSLIDPKHPTGFVIWKNANSSRGVSVDELADFCTCELRMMNLERFFQKEFRDGCVLRERQDTKARFEVSSTTTKDNNNTYGSEGSQIVAVRISSLFATIEEHKEELLLADYGVSQTSLEQVFNMHAAEAEKRKKG